MSQNNQTQSTIGQITQSLKKLKIEKAMLIK